MANLLIFFLGTSFGSFIGLVVDRFPEKSILYPQSHCDSCGNCLQVRDLIPIFSQLINKSRCRWCNQKIPWRYVALETILGIVFYLAWCGQFSGSQVFIICLSLTLSLYDWRNQSFPLLVWLIPSLVALPFTGINSLALCFLLFGVMAELVDLKIGSGDFYYLATLSLFLSFQEILWVVQLASLSAILACFFIQTKRLPFVPFLFFGYLVISNICF